jgi:hypothetical protein
MAFPQVRSIGIYESTIINQNHTACNYPATVEPGDLLLFLLSNDGTNQSPTVNSTSVPGVATLISDGHPTPYNHGHGIAWVEAVGDEDGGTFQSDITGSEEMCVACLAISGWDGVTAPQVSTDTVGNSTAPNAASLTATWGAADNLWISFISYNLNLGTLTYPTNYSSIQNELNSNGNINGLAFATREYSASDTEDVGAWSTTTANGWGAFTIVVRPASAGGRGGVLNGVARGAMRGVG